MPSATNDLNQLIASTRNAIGYTETSNSDGTTRHVMPRRAAGVLTMSLRNATALTQPANPLRAVRSGLPDASTPGSVITLEKALVANSRCIEAGSRAIVVPGTDEARIINGETVFEQRDIRFELIEPTPAIRDVEGSDFPTGHLAIYRDRVDLKTMPLVGIHISLTRAEMRKFNEGELAASAMTSIMLGLGRAIDEVVLSAILGNRPGPFGPQAAAAAGLRFSELRALIGTNGMGAGVADDGSLRAGWGTTAGNSGIIAELTDVMVETVIGDFSRSAVALHEEIRLVADRTNTKGDLTLTAIAGIQALLPRPDVFWVRG